MNYLYNIIMKKQKKNNDTFIENFTTPCCIKTRKRDNTEEH